MVVEDEFLIAMGLEMTLQSAGYTVLEPISSVEAALNAAAGQSADLALLDVNLAGQRVFPVADILSSRQVPFIFITACDEQALPPRFAGTPVLVKPVSPEKLLNTISRTLRGALGHSVCPTTCDNAN